MVSEIFGLYKVRGVQHVSWDPRPVSLNASYHKEQEYGLGVGF